MPFSKHYANSVLNFAFAKNTSISFPSKAYIGLCSNDPEQDQRIFELSGNGYSRVLISAKGEEYPNQMAVATDREIFNAFQINWTKATGDWMEAKGFFITSNTNVVVTTDDENVIFYGKLQEPVTVEAGMVALFDPRAFRISFPLKDDIIIFTTKYIENFEHNATYGQHASEVAVHIPIIAGNRYRVVWDGADYIVTAQDTSSLVSGSVSIGNGTDYGFDGNDEPFAIICQETTTTFIAVGNEFKSHTCTIYNAD